MLTATANLSEPAESIDMTTPTENRAINARRVLGLVATLHQNLECGDYGATWT